MVWRSLAIGTLLLSGCLDAQRGAVSAVGDVVADAAGDAAADASPDVSLREDVPATADVRDVTADVPPDPNTLVLAPESLSFFYLPIGSVRHAVSGYDPAKGLCATMVWWGTAGHCSEGGELPYVILAESDDGSCGQWEYGGNAEVHEAMGCVDLAEEGVGHMDLVDVELKVTSALFTGRVVADNRSSRSPRPVTLGIRYTTDIPEDVWVQTSDELGLPTWVRVRREGQPVQIFDRCDQMQCGESTGVCGAAMPRVANLTGGLYGGRIALSWDGFVRRATAAGCYERVPAPPGAYVATFCIAWKVDVDFGWQGTVVDPFCQEVPFTLPTDIVFWEANFGG